MVELHPENKCSHLVKKFDYDPEAMKIMYEMQKHLQLMYALKRGTINLPEKVSHEHTLEACYHWSTFTTEYFELMDRLLFSNGEPLGEQGLIEVKYEVIDMWHFLMNIFIYTAIRDLPFDLMSFFVDFEPIDVINSSEISYHFSRIGRWVGEYFNLFPFKKWKTYDKTKIEVPRAKELISFILFEFFEIARHVNIGSAEEFFSLYLNKNEENFKRQGKKGIYAS